MNKNKFVVSAENTQQAIKLWFESKNKEYQEDNRPLEFNPRDFSIRELEREDLVIRASE